MTIVVYYNFLTIVLIMWITNVAIGDITTNYVMWLDISKVLCSDMSPVVDGDIITTCNFL